MRRAWVPAAIAVGVASLVAGLLIGIAGQAPAPTAAGSGQPETVVIAPLEGTVAPGPTLVFASFNVCKVDCAPPAPSWDVRRERVARVIAESGVDVIGLQEVTFNPTSTAKTQFLDLQNLLAPSGFVAPTMTPDSDQCRWTASNPHPCNNTTGLMFNTRTVRQASTPNGSPSAGTLPSSAIVAGLTEDSGPRKVSWAYLEGLDGTGTFLALSIHTSNLKDAANEASRVALGQALDGWTQAWNAAHGMAGIPVVLMGDLNSYAKRQPNGVQAVLVSSGWVDSATAPEKRNVQYSTINYNPMLGLAEQGFPAKPYVFHTSRNKPVLDATRIDYVMAKGAGLQPMDYEVVIRLNADGSFIPDYQASDHQMVRSTVAFAGR
jgi:endonuclease/exonuclease/phosphatase family metal-dependent hydrolase